MIIYNAFREWLKHLFTPHCDHCELKIKCESCENWKEVNAILMKQNQQLLDRLCLLPEVSVNEIKSSEHKSINQFTPWRVRQAQFEQASRIKREQIAQASISKDLTIKAPKSIEELESELLEPKDATGT